MIVIDASFAVDAALSPKGPAWLKGRDAVAPPLMRSEATSTLHRMMGRSHLSRPEAEESFARLLGLAVSRKAPASLAKEAWRVADLLGWEKTYDAEYVALARLLDCPLVTTDARLKRGAASVATIVGPTEL